MLRRSRSSGWRRILKNVPFVPHAMHAHSVSSIRQVFDRRPWESVWLGGLHCLIAADGRETRPGAHVSGRSHGPFCLRSVAVDAKGTAISSPGESTAHPQTPCRADSRRNTRWKESEGSLRSVPETSLLAAARLRRAASSAPSPGGQHAVPAPPLRPEDPGSADGNPPGPWARGLLYDCWRSLLRTRALHGVSESRVRWTPCLRRKAQAGSLSHG